MGGDEVPGGLLDNALGIFSRQWVGDQPIIHASPAMLQYVRMSKARSPSAAIRERRAHERFPLTQIAVGCELDPAGQPVGDRYEVVLRDVSRFGVSFVHPRMVTQPWFAVTLKREDGAIEELIVQVCRCRPSGMYFEVAGMLAHPTDIGSSQAKPDPSGS